jgi:competence protein CoiA
MHLFALDSLGKITAAKQASKQHDYRCLECNGIVRRRSGVHRTPHFFHLKPTEFCRQQGKSIIHLQVQCLLQSLLPPGEVQLECSFPSINRIADVAWLTQGLIFEVQCSPISPEEIRERQIDYQSQGFTVVWILHDHRFNQWRVTAAEDFLQPFPHYFTNIDADGKGFIYDPFQILRNGIRQNKMEPLIIDLTRPIFLNPGSLKKNPSMSSLMNFRLFNWPLYFEGDWLFKALQDPSVLEGMDLKEENVKVKSPLSYLTRWMRLYICRPYDLLFKLLLEKVCK